jgi:hypothetical protein
MIQIYAKYTEWEDYKNGMYSCSKKNEHEYIIKSKELLCNNEKFYETGLKVIKEWVVSTGVNLTNRKTNRRSWIGQACCCYLCGSNEISTRKSWKLLSLKEKENANLIADKLIKIYETRNYKIHKNVGEKMLF